MAGFLQLKDSFDKQGREGISNASKIQTEVFNANEALEQADDAARKSAMGMGAGIGASAAIAGGGGALALTGGVGLGIAAGYLAYEYL